MATVADAWRWVLRTVQPVTALITILMILAYLDCTNFHRLLQPQNSLGWRALLCVFYHKSGLHLFVDILWTLNMGAHFEKLHGSWRFLGKMTLMIFLSQGFTLLVNLLYVVFREQRQHFTMSPLQLNNCTLGFSGVLFALHSLLVTSSQYHFRRDSFQNVSQHHGLKLMEGLFLLAGLHTLILPDSHFLNNLSGIVAGIVYVNTPRILKNIMVYAIYIYIDRVQPMCCTMYKVFYNLGIKVKEYYTIVQFPQYRRSFDASYVDNDHNDVEQEENEEEEDDNLDANLQWECKTCLRKNGVFLSFCEFCRHSRTWW